MSQVASWQNAFLTRLAKAWISLLLVGGIIGTLIVDLQKVAWYRDSVPWVVLVLLGSSYGAVLAWSRLRGRSAVLLAASTSIGAGLLFVGRILPSPETLSALPFSESLWLTHVRLLTWLGRLGDGFAGLLHGVQATDPSVLAFVLGCTVYGASVWLLWCIVRRRRALEGVLPYGAVLAVNVLASGRDSTFPLVFIICAVLLIARTAYTERLRDWDMRQVGYPELIGEDWSVGALAVSALVVLFAVISMPDVRRSLSDLFTVQLSPEPDAGDERALASDFFDARVSLQMPDMRILGASLPQSDATIMWVQTSDPAPIVDTSVEALSAVPRHYWRGAIFARYIGSGWEPAVSLQLPSSVPESPAQPAPGRYALWQRFNIVSSHDENLMSVNTPVVAGAGTSLRRVAPDGDALLQGTLSDYEVTSWATQVTQEQLLLDSTDYPPDILDAYLQLPDSLPQRVRALAARITSGVHTPYEKAVRIADYLRLSYPYRLDVPAPPPGRDAVDYFLFDAPGGFCSYYASAMVILLRAEGVPARLATGFATGVYDIERGAYRVPATAAHAWVEVYFPSWGWVEFEPTAALPSIDYPLEVQPTSVADVPSQPVVIQLPSGQALAFGAAMLIGSGVLIVLFVRFRRRESLRELRHEDPARALYWRMRGTLRRIGLEAPATVTPDEFLALYALRLSERQRLLEALRYATAVYVRETYASNDPNQVDLRASRKAWRQAWPDCLRLGLVETLARLKHKQTRLLRSRQVATVAPSRERPGSV